MFKLIIMYYHIYGKSSQSLSVARHPHKTVFSRLSVTYLHFGPSHAFPLP